MTVHLTSLGEKFGDFGENRAPFIVSGASGLTFFSLVGQMLAPGGSEKQIPDVM